MKNKYLLGSPPSTTVQFPYPTKPPNQDTIFVFGSNLAGRHGAGAALTARKNWGAALGAGKGLQGLSYALPTKNAQLQSLPLEDIKKEVQEFLNIAKIYKYLTFWVTPIGCGLAGYTPKQIAPFFRGSPNNVVLPPQFKEEL